MSLLGADNFVQGQVSLENKKSLSNRTSSNAFELVLGQDDWRHLFLKDKSSKNKMNSCQNTVHLAMQFS